MMMDDIDGMDKGKQNKATCGRLRTSMKDVMQGGMEAMRSNHGAKRMNMMGNDTSGANAKTHGEKNGECSNICTAICQRLEN